MTIHLAFARAGEAILLSDSQGSTDLSESHGIHKQFVGENFVVGVAGHAKILLHLFDALDDKIGAQTAATPDQLTNIIETFIDLEVREKYWDRIQILLVVAEGTDCAIREHSPAVFKRFGMVGSFTGIGSGADFVERARLRHAEMGMTLPTQSLADMLATATFYAAIANESIAVDDQLMVTMIANKRSYLLGDESIHVAHVPPEITLNWKSIANHWNGIRGIVKSIDGELREAQRITSTIRSGTFLPSFLKIIEQACYSVEKQRTQLNDKISEFKSWYDSLLSRSSDASMD